MADLARPMPRIPSDDPMPPDVRTWLGVQRRLTFELLRDDEPPEKSCEPFDFEGIILLLG